MHKSGFVNIIGNPNVGKSTLMNALVGEKLSIITSKAQTTRHRIMGIVSGEDFQIVYSDTPGILKPSYKLQESMMKFVTGAVADADVILYVTDTVERGERVALVGPNGAGKSTTMKMLLGLTAPTKGSFTIDGKQFPNDRIAILKEIGSFIEAPSFYANLTGRENLDIIRRILGLPKADVEDALELVGLTEFGDRLAKKYSLGMKQRLGLAGALLGRPPILILDEPTNGLDPSGIHEIRNLVKSLPSLYDCTVLISSHMLSEIELIADDIGILNHGRMLFEGSMNDLRQYALQSGFAADNLEDVFLSMVEKDNMDRKQRAKL